MTTPLCFRSALSFLLVENVTDPVGAGPCAGATHTVLPQHALCHVCNNARDVEVEVVEATSRSQRRIVLLINHFAIL